MSRADHLIAPHGGTLTTLVATPERSEELRSASRGPQDVRAMIEPLGGFVLVHLVIDTADLSPEEVILHLVRQGYVKD